MILIAGPCVIESEAHVLEMAEMLNAIAEWHHLDFYFKASWDKANRSKYDSYRGVHLHEGMAILDKVKTKIGCKVTSDIHESCQAQDVKEVLDLIQIPALLCRQTSLIQAAGNTGKPVNIKKGQFMSPYAMEDPVKKASVVGASRIMVTERGTSFGYGNDVVDMRSLIIMKDLMPTVSVIFDATHSTGGNAGFAQPLARAAAAVGIDGLFVECHDRPLKALCDGPCMITPSQLDDLLRDILE